MNIDRELESILTRVEKPARYTGGEVNMIRKKPEAVDVRMGFAFPDTYEIGMSYMGMQILYDILNRNDRIYCERIFAPGGDMETIMREKKRSLYTLETFTSIEKLDIVGFTLQYEMSYTNILNMLDLGNIPVAREERKASDRDLPIVIGGGPCAFNPEPLADFFDVFLLGDGEELLEKVCIAFADAKSKKSGHEATRKMFLESIMGMDGVYIPEYYDVKYFGNHAGEEVNTISQVTVLDDSAPEIVKRAIVKDIDKADYPVNNIVPFIDTVHDRAVVETFRGCTRGCRFCQAGMIYRPVRERKTETITDLAMKQLANTGHEELSLLSLSTSDYSDFENMATGLMKKCKEQNVSLSLPSLRLDSFSFRVLEEIQGYRKSGLTFAPEAGTQRLRDVINKNITDDDIYGATKQAVELGWEHIKLYFMIGLPTETFEDLDGIAEIARNIMNINYDVRGRKGGRFRVTVSVSNFVPKPHTPFQWEPQDRPKILIEKHNYLSEKLRIKGVTFNYHDSETSSLEAVFARGDRRCCKVIEKAWKSGCSFDAWTEHFNPELWNKAFEEASVECGFAGGVEMIEYYNYRKRDTDEILPWDMFDSFVDRDFLVSEKNRSENAITTPDCRLGCCGCGVNRYADCFVNCRK